MLNHDHQHALSKGCTKTATKKDFKFERNKKKTETLLSLSQLKGKTGICVTFTDLHFSYTPTSPFACTKPNNVIL